MLDIKTLKQRLSSPAKIVVLPHRKPDADALGSCVAVATYLNKLGHQAKIISPTDYPEFLFWLEGTEEVLNFEEDSNDQAVKLIQEAEFIFCLDFSSLNRIDKMGDLVKNATGIKVLIDHHRGKEDFADFELWDIEASATAELVYDFIVMMGDVRLIDTFMATAIYAGIMTDTGSFKYPSTTSKVHRIIADLMDLGIDAPNIHRRIYDASSEDRIRFLGYALSQKLTILREYHTAFFAITHQELKDFNSQTGDTEGLVNYALSVKGIKMAALFIEKKDHVKMSFRSIGNISVATIANKYFNGGGHQNAAGGLSHDALEQVVDQFKSILPAYKSILDSEEE